MGMTLYCPKCESKVPMVFDQEKSQWKCISCGSIVSGEVFDDKKPLEKPKTVEHLKATMEKARSIVQSALERKINIECTIGGKWGRQFVAVQTLMVEGLGMEQNTFLGSLIKNGISSMFNVFGNYAAMSEAFQQMAKEGTLSQETAENVIRDLSQLNKEAMGGGTDLNSRSHEDEEGEKQ